MTILDTTPRGTQAAILRKIAQSRYPKIDMPNVASVHHMTLAEVQTILGKYGYPDAARMLAAAAQLELAQEPTATGAPGASMSDDENLGTLSQIPVDTLLPDPDNPRDGLSDIEELADSMLEVGLLQPIVARRHPDRPGHLYVVAGHRRLAAAKHLKWTHVPCIVRGAMSPDDVLAAMLVENGQRKDLDPIEEARGLKRLKAQMGCSDTELGKRIGRSQPVVSARLALLSLTPEEQEQIRRGEMTLIEGTNKGRLNSGKLGPTGVDRNWHLGPNHPLATKAKARCRRLKHKNGRIIGGMGCGACWESVIRADTQDHLQEVVGTTGRCTICGHAEDHAGTG